MTHNLHFPPPTASRRARERLARRQEILHAARQVFAQRGYRNATLDEIAGRAEFAKGTIYNYFRSKEEIFRQIITTLLDDLLRIAETAVREEHSARESCARYASDAIAYYRSHEDVLRIVVRDVFRLELEDTERRMAEIHRRFEGIAATLARSFRREIRGRRGGTRLPDDLAQIFVAIVHHRSVKCIFQGTSIQELDPHEEASFITTLFFDGAPQH